MCPHTPYTITDPAMAPDMDAMLTLEPSCEIQSELVCVLCVVGTVNKQHSEYSMQSTGSVTPHQIPIRKSKSNARALSQCLSVRLPTGLSPFLSLIAFRPPGTDSNSFWHFSESCYWRSQGI